MYGCGAVLDGSPIGGGLGSVGLYSQSDGDYVAGSWADLKAVLAEASGGQIVYLADGAVIELSADSQMHHSGAGLGLWVPDRVTLAAGRGISGVTPGRIEVASGFRPNDWCYLLGLGTGARICGLELAGHQDTTETGYTWSAIRCGVGSEVAASEIHGFGYAGVTAFPDITDAWVHHNYIHHCQGSGHGYGVEVAAVTGTLSHDREFHIASALVEGNIFDYTRHCIANQSGRGSYTFRHNRLGAHAAYESQCDVHGQNDGPSMDMEGGQYVYCAGELVEIYNNTSECSSANEFVGIRGIPYGSERVKVHHNWLKVAGDPALIVQFMFRMPGWAYDAIDDRGSLVSGAGYGPFVQVDSYDNWYGEAAPPSEGLRKLAVSYTLKRL